MAPVDHPYLHVYQVRDRWFAYYRRNGKRTRLPDFTEPPSAEFSAAYHTAHQWAEFSADQEPQPPARDDPKPHSLRALVELFRRDPEYRQLKPKTKKDYDRLLDPIVEDWGHKDARVMPRSWVKDRRAELQDKPRTANYTVAVISRLMTFAIDREWRKDNPAAGVAPLAVGEGHRAWTDAEIETCTGTAAPAWLRRAVMLALYTAQRQSDVLSMPWVRYQNGRIRLRQSKTGVELVIPVHPALADELAAGPKTAAVMCTRPDGMAWKADWFRHSFATARVDLGLPKDLTFHGLRHSAASRLAEAGASDAEIAAITGHKTRSMVAHYSSGARQETLAGAGLARLPRRVPGGKE